MSNLWNTFGFTEEQRMMRDSVADLLARVLPPQRCNLIAWLMGL